MELPELAPIIDLEEVKVMKWKQGNIPVTYESMGVDIGLGDMFPSYLSCRPEVGDIVESVEGRRLSIKAVVHSIENNSAVLKVVLGKDTGGQHEESGGATETDW